VARRSTFRSATQQNRKIVRITRRLRLYLQGARPGPIAHSGNGCWRRRLELLQTERLNSIGLFRMLDWWLKRHVSTRRSIRPAWTGTVTRKNGHSCRSRAMGATQCRDMRAHARTYPKDAKMTSSRAGNWLTRHHRLEPGQSGRDDPARVIPALLWPCDRAFAMIQRAMIQDPVHGRNVWQCSCRGH